MGKRVQRGPADAGLRVEKDRITLQIFTVITRTGLIPRLPQELGKPACVRSFLLYTPKRLLWVENGEESGISSRTAAAVLRTVPGWADAAAVVGFRDG